MNPAIAQLAMLGVELILELIRALKDDKQISQEEQATIKSRLDGLFDRIGALKK